MTASAPADDTAAVETIRANGADLLAYLARRTFSPEDAADVFGNVLVVIWSKRRDLPTAAEEARMWSFGIARNALRDYRRRGIRQSALADALRADLIDRLTLEHDADPAEIAHRTRRSEDVRSAVARLPTRDRELIMLVHWDGFALAQAAALLGVNASTARTRYARARRRLAAELADHRGSENVARPRRSAGLRQQVGDQPEASA